jgi:S-disulfanyl-L-cysteine oxidoreductase SoxD
MRLMLAFLLTVVVAAGSGLILSAQAKKSQWDGVYTAEQATRGEATYKAKCSICHGGQLQGYVQNAIPAPSLTGEEFEKNWDDFPLSDLFDKIKNSMPQDDPGILTATQTSEVIAFMLQGGKYPAGTTELSSDVEQLKSIKFLVKKPA